MNRGNARRAVFHKDGDYAAFVKLVREAGERTPIRLLAYCLIPWHHGKPAWTPDLSCGRPTGCNGSTSRRLRSRN